MTPPKKKMPPLRYFFYRGDLHKKQQINRGADIITAWNYPKATLERYIYSDVRKNGEKAFTTKQVCAMVQRGRTAVESAITDGMVPRPQFTYGMDENRNMYAYYWSEKDILALHDYFKSLHHGRPRIDGEVTPKQLPSAAELRSLIRQGTVFYVKRGDEFVPTWQAEKF